MFRNFIKGLCKNKISCVCQYYLLLQFWSEGGWKLALKVGFCDGSGSKTFDLGQVWSIFHWSGRVSQLWSGFGFGKLPLKITKTFFTWDQKISLGWVKKYPGKRWVTLFFAVGQKYGRLGQGPSLVYLHNSKKRYTFYPNVRSFMLSF